MNLLHLITSYSPIFFTSRTKVTFFKLFWSYHYGSKVLSSWLWLWLWLLLWLWLWLIVVAILLLPLRGDGVVSKFLAALDGND